MPNISLKLYVTTSFRALKKWKTLKTLRLFVQVFKLWEPWFDGINFDTKSIISEEIILLIAYPANISTSDERCFNVVDQRWNNVDPTLKMKQNPTSDFQRYTKLMQRQCPTLKQRWNNVDITLSRRCFNVSSTLVKAISKPVRLVISADL